MNPQLLHETIRPAEVFGEGVITKFRQIERLFWMCPLFIPNTEIKVTPRVVAGAIAAVLDLRIRRVNTRISSITQIPSEDLLILGDHFVSVWSQFSLRPFLIHCNDPMYLLSRKMESSVADMFYSKEEKNDIRLLAKYLRSEKESSSPLDPGFNEVNDFISRMAHM